ncbi:MAG TPA: hypothetical protein VKB58_04435 [Terriglobales bacterium]|nr:hypothetical protein [Terriglobales bacterium]
MAVPICEHIKPSGKRCGSPALRDKSFCYYHSNVEECLPSVRNMFAVRNPNAAPGEWPFTDFPAPVLEDAAAIQVGFTQALYGVANGHLDLRRAKLVLSALHGASANLKRLEACLTQCVNALQRKRPTGVKQALKRARRSDTVSLSHGS